MKISEVLELTQHKRLAEIAKESLEIGEKKATEALKKAGCYSISGKRGWHFDGDKRVLEQSIYNYSSPNQRVVNSANKEVSATIEKAKVVNNPSFQQSDKKEKKQKNKLINKEINKEDGKSETQQSKNIISKPVMKKVTYEIEEQLHDELKIKSIREKRTVSEIVNEIIKKGIR